MMEIFLDALYDSLKTIPYLLILYIGIELLEYKLGNVIREKVQKAGRLGPLLGAITGAFPQCGFSVIATALFTQRLITMGTLMAVYISTSDEAIPIILSHPEKAHLIWPLIMTKMLMAVIAGYIIDLVLRKDSIKTREHVIAFESGHDDKKHHHEEIVNETACCGHSSCVASNKFSWKEIIWHPIVHTINVFGFIFVVTLILNLMFWKLGEVTIFNNVFVTALLGLIPNCAASVTITELYLKNAIGFGPVVAGLSSSGGLGILVLYREEKNRKLFFKIIGLLYFFSVLFGLIFS